MRCLQIHLEGELAHVGEGQLKVTVQVLFIHFLQHAQVSPLDS